MEALWSSVVRGAELTRSYLFVRVKGAVQDEMRKMGHGSRTSGYLCPEDFSDRSEAPGSHPEDDLIANIDGVRRLEQLSPRERTLLGRLVAGDEQQAIAKDMGVSSQRVNQLLARIKRGVATTPKPTKLEHVTTERCAELRAQGFTRAQIARHLGCSESLVTRRLKPRPPRKCA